MGFGSFFPDVAAKNAAPKKTDRWATSVETLHRLECEACPLKDCKGLKHPNMAPTGAEKPSIYFLGEAPGADEDAQGRQFVGKSGRILRDLVPDELEDEIRWNNCVRTRPPDNRTPTMMEIEACRPSIERDIEAARPKAIFGFGGVPLRWALDEDGIYKWRGRYIPVKIGKHTCWFFPMLHPAGLLRMRRKNKRTGRVIKSEAERTFERDLARAFKLVEKLPLAKVSTPYRTVKPGKRKSSNTEFAGVEFVTGENSAEDVRRIRAWLDKLRDEEIVGIDLETASDEKMGERQTRPFGHGSRILTAALATKQAVLAFPFRHREAKWSSAQLVAVEDAFLDFLLTADCVKVAHNLSFELEWLGNFFGLDIVYSGAWGDTMGQAYVLDERRSMLKLDLLILLCFGFHLKRIVKVNRARLDYEPLEVVLPYNGLDALWTNKLFHRQRARLKQEGLLDVYEMHIPPVQAAVITQIIGNKIDFACVRAFDKKYSTQLVKLRKWLESSKAAAQYEQKFGQRFKPSAHDDVIKIFRDIFQRPEGWVEDADGRRKYSCEDSVLKQINTPLARKIQAFRAVSGNKSKYVDPLNPDNPDGGKCIFPDGLLHPNIHIFFTDTGRTSSSFPNEQNWPKRDEDYRDLRSEFVAEEDCYLVAVDQGQVEARTIQMAAKDKRYGKYLWDRHDIHMEWAERLAHAWPRRIGGKKFLKDTTALKAFRYDVKNQWTFPLFFGATDWSVSNYLSMPREVVSPLVDQFWEEFSGVKEWQEELEAFYDRYGYVACLTGRRRRAPISHNELINSPIQGTASDITTKAWSRLSRAAWELDMWRFQAQLEIHDELVFQIPKKTFDRDVEFICDYLLDCEHFDFINVPLCVEVSRGPNWFEQTPVMTLFSDDFGKIDRKQAGF